MQTVVERSDGSRKVSISFPQDEFVLRRKSSDRKSFYEYYPARSRTKPEFHKQVDIRRIMKKYENTGVIEPLIMRDLHYGDFSDGVSFADAAIRVADAVQQFEGLPHQIRNRFKNDPKLLLDHLASKEQKDVFESIDLGLVKEVITRETKDGFDFVYRNGFEISKKPVVAPSGAAAPAGGQPGPAASGAGSGK